MRSGRAARRHRAGARHDRFAAKGAPAKSTRSAKSAARIWTKYMPASHSAASAARREEPRALPSITKSRWKRSTRNDASVKPMNPQLAL